VNREQEFRLYLALQCQLALSRVAFKRFYLEAIKHKDAQLGRLLQGGARMLPGWVTYLQEVAFPLNQKSEELVSQIAELTDDLPQPLQAFLRYQKAIKAKYEEWKQGGVLDQDLTAGFNFPANLDIYIDRHLAALTAEPEFRHLVLQPTPTGENIMSNKSGAGPADAPTTTTNPTDGSTKLIESLRGISAAGDGADVLTIRVLGLERAKLVAMRGTKGVNRDEPTTFVRYMDMTDAHLENTLKFGKNVSGDEKRVIESILEDRQAASGGDPVDADDDDLTPAPIL